MAVLRTGWGFVAAVMLKGLWAMLSDEWLPDLLHTMTQ